MNQTEFAQLFRDRTKNLTIDVINVCKKIHKNESRIVTRQLIRSASSVGANYRAACRARSSAEFFAKMSIVVEEADEALFWLEILEQTEMAEMANLKNITSEATEILYVMAKARGTMKKKS